MLDVMRFWLDRGLDGFRCDAVPYLVEREGTNCENLPETHAILKEFRAVIDREYGGARLLLAEANQWPEDVASLLRRRRRVPHGVQLPAHAAPVSRPPTGGQPPDHRHLHADAADSPGCQWGLFLRNHDELTLEMVTDEERAFMYYAYAHERDMKLNLGIRRRLAPLMDGDRRRVELLNCLLLTLPGSPIIYYGDEIGMGDNGVARRPRRRAHAHAVVARPQRGILERRARASLPAGHHGSGLRLRGGERGRADATAVVAPQHDATAPGGAADVAGLRAWHHRVPAPAQLASARVSAPARARDAADRRQPLAGLLSRSSSTSPRSPGSRRPRCWAGPRFLRSGRARTS